jgi:hypothetical protein
VSVGGARVGSGRGALGAALWLYGRCAIRLRGDGKQLLVVVDAVVGEQLDRMGLAWSELEHGVRLHASTCVVWCGSGSGSKCRCLVHAFITYLGLEVKS